MAEIEAIAGIGAADPGGAAALHPAGSHPVPKPPTPQAAMPETASVESPDDVGLVFEVGRGAADLVIKVVDRRSHRVIREIPPEEMRRMRSSVQAALGRFLDQAG